MKLLNSCILCGSSNLKPFSMTFKIGFPHISRVKCKSCSAVFANPISEEEELMKFYQNYYDKGNFELFNYKKTHIQKFSEYEKTDKTKLIESFNYVLKYKKTGKFLDIGFGLGEPLFLAHLHGFKVSGTEFDADAIEFISGYIPEGNWHEGDLMNSNYEYNSFDFIRFWHVIEHVLSPQKYVKEIKRFLKPGGVVMIGTPNIDSKGYSLYRFFSFLFQKIPGIVDGMEHTILFNRNTLSKLLKDEGFEIIEHYTHSHVENYKDLLIGELPLWKKFVRVIQSIFKVNQTIYAKKIS